MDRVITVIGSDVDIPPYSKVEYMTSVLLIIMVLWISGCSDGAEKTKKDSSSDRQEYDATRLMSNNENKGFKRAYGNEVIEFPAAFGAHPEYRTEWWYYTGNLETREGRNFGFELTIFRNGLIPESTIRSDSSSDWRTRHLYMGHLALADISNNQFYSYERYSRGAAGLAGAQADPFRVWLENWEIHSTDTINFGLVSIPVMTITAEAGDIKLDLTLISEKPPVLQGKEGWDQKGPQEGNASYYFSLTRLSTSGKLNVGGESFDVSGSSWMDREWSTSALGENQEGWDWFALQLSNDVEIMYYRLRNKDGSSSRFSSGIIVNEQGQKSSFTADQIELTPEEYWTSPTTGARYPVQWQMEIPDRSISLSVIPKMENQELQTQFKYWEGAVRIEGAFGDSTVSGEGYVELTGY